MADITDRIRHELAVEALAQQFSKPKREVVVEEKVSNNGWTNRTTGNVNWEKQDSISLGKAANAQPSGPSVTGVTQTKKKNKGGKK